MAENNGNGENKWKMSLSEWRGQISEKIHRIVADIEKLIQRSEEQRRELDLCVRDIDTLKDHMFFVETSDKELDADNRILLLEKAVEQIVEQKLNNRLQELEKKVDRLAYKVAILAALLAYLAKFLVDKLLGVFF